MCCPSEPSVNKVGTFKNTRFLILFKLFLHAEAAEVARGEQKIATAQEKSNLHLLKRLLIIT